MEVQERPSTVTVNNSFDDLFKSVEDVNVTPPVEVIQENTNTPDTITTEVPTITEEAPKVVSKHKERLSQLIEDKILENFAIGVVDENGERKEVHLSDLEDVDSDMYSAILEKHKEAKDKEISEKYISKDGLDDTFLKIIETRKAGGNIDEIVKENVSAIDSWVKTKETLQDNEQVQVNVVAWQLRQQGVAEPVIEAQIKYYIDNLQLDSEAEKIVDFHLNSHKEEIERKRETELERVIKEKESQKQFKKTLTGTYKEWGIPKNIQDTIVEASTKLNQDGLTNTEILIFNAQKDNPELFAKLAFLVHNPKEFETFISGKKVEQVKKEAVKTFFDINLKSVKPSTPTKSNNSFDELFPT